MRRVQRPGHPPTGTQPQRPTRSLHRGRWWGPGGFTTTSRFIVILSLSGLREWRVPSTTMPVHSPRWQGHRSRLWGRSDRGSFDGRANAALSPLWMSTCARRGRAPSLRPTSDPGPRWALASGPHVLAPIGEAALVWHDRAPGRQDPLPTSEPSTVKGVHRPVRPEKRIFGAAPRRRASAIGPKVPGGEDFVACREVTPLASVRLRWPSAARVICPRPTERGGVADRQAPRARSAERPL
jgi:hypothetical protein